MFAYYQVRSVKISTLMRRQGVRQESERGYGNELASMGGWRNFYYLSLHHNLA